MDPKFKCNEEQQLEVSLYQEETNENENIKPYSFLLDL